MHSLIVLLTAAAVSLRALEMLTSPLPLSLWIILSGSTAPGTGTAEPKEIVILHSAKCKMSALSHIPLLDKQIENLGFKGRIAVECLRIFFLPCILKRKISRTQFEHTLCMRVQCSWPSSYRFKIKFHIVLTMHINIRLQLSHNPELGILALQVCVSLTETCS